MSGNSPGQPAADAPKPRNAFENLMSRKTQNQTTSVAKSGGILASRKDGLGVYIDAPESFSPSRVIYYTPDFVAIHDMYPKSAIHLLLLPRDPTKLFLHPFDAFEDPEFLSSVKVEVSKLKKLAAGELRRRFGKMSAKEGARLVAMDAEDLPDELPVGRNWEEDVINGIHAHPSMNHLHIHILSQERCSETMKHRKHYNSFATPFFIPIEDFPLDQNDPRRHPGRQGYLNRDLQCWRCGETFGNKFARLKEHLKLEFEQWVKE
ncbi:MAG: aprataxin-like protein [Vezdaea aestivalis]|nr:MAG: aprataxin-like protein [Vezdaea aestivalis]